MRPILPAAAAAALALTACAEPPRRPTMTWWHPTPSAQRANTDRYECTREAAIAAPPSQQLSSTGGYEIGGYWIPPSVRSHDGNAAARDNLFGLCLRARGYVLAAEDPFTRRQPTTAQAR
jgi:hypothetical protein